MDANKGVPHPGVPLGIMRTQSDMTHARSYLRKVQNSEKDKSVHHQNRYAPIQLNLDGKIVKPTKIGEVKVAGLKEWLELKELGLGQYYNEAAAW